jgi:hypothetical protein
MGDNKLEWIHEGVLYGERGYIGSYYNNSTGWYVRIPRSGVSSGCVKQVKSRTAAIRALENEERRRKHGG